MTEKFAGLRKIEGFRLPLLSCDKNKSDIVNPEVLTNTMMNGAYIFTSKTGENITIDGKQVAATYLIDDNFGNHETQFDEAVKAQQGPQAAKRNDMAQTRLLLGPFLDKLVAQKPFNSPGNSIYYLG